MMIRTRSSGSNGTRIALNATSVRKASSGRRSPKSAWLRCPELQSRSHVVLMQFVPKDGKLWCAPCVPQQSSGICKKCNQPIVGAAAKVGDDKYHPTCFVCADCKAPLGGQTFFPKDGETFCQRCIESKVGSCSACKMPVLKNPIRALAKAWHRECFTYGPDRVYRVRVALPA